MFILNLNVKQTDKFDVLNLTMEAENVPVLTGFLLYRSSSNVVKKQSKPKFNSNRCQISVSSPP